MDVDDWFGGKTNKIARNFFLFAAILIIIILYTTIASLFESTNLGVLNNCIDSKVGDPILIQNERIINPKTAKVILDTHFNETHSFLKADLSNCGAIYIFKGVVESYAVCETGEVYIYGKICKIKTLEEKSKRLIDIVMNTTNITK